MTQRITHIPPLDYFASRIHNWVCLTFGHPTPDIAARRLKMEVDELCESPTSQEELADCLIVLLECATCQGITVDDLVRLAVQKQWINERREWVVGEDGMGRHKKTGGESA